MQSTVWHWWTNLQSFAYWTQPRPHSVVKGGIYPTITLSSFFKFHYFVVSITKKWSACRPLITQLFLFCIFFSSALLSFPFLLFFCIIAKLRFSMHEGSANTHSRTMAADAKLQKCMRRARGLQQRMQQQQEQQQEPSRPQGPNRYLYCHPVCPANPLVQISTLPDPRGLYGIMIQNQHHGTNFFLKSTIPAYKHSLCNLKHESRVAV